MGNAQQHINPTPGGLTPGKLALFSLCRPRGVAGAALGPGGTVITHLRTAEILGCGPQTPGAGERVLWGAISPGLTRTGDEFGGYGQLVDAPSVLCWTRRGLLCLMKLSPPWSLLWLCSGVRQRRADPRAVPALETAIQTK